MRIMHIIAGLNTGGAEIMLYKLLTAMDRSKYTPEVISLTDIGPIGEKIQELGVPVRALGMSRGVANPMYLFKLVHWLRQSRPNVVQTWMYHADLIGGLAAKIAGGIPLAWGVHHSNLDAKGNKRGTIWSAWICSRLSKWLPTRIVYCSDGAYQVHIDLGYKKDKAIIIPNGIDLFEFVPDPIARQTVRQELGIEEDIPLIGLVARFDPQKDHRNFVEAASKLNASYPNVQFLLCGDGINWSNRILSGWINEAGLSQNFHLLGRRQDVARLTASLDIATSSSYGESFALTLGEAMACGVPCVTTDIEGPVSLLGGFGWVVPISDSQALCSAWCDILSTSENDLEKQIAGGQRHIREHYSLDRMVNAYEKLFESICDYH